MIPSIVRFSKELTWFEKILYAEILSLSQRRGYAYPKNKTLASWYGVTPRYIRECIKKLEKHGFVEIEQYPGKSRHVWPLHQALVREAAESEFDQAEKQGGTTVPPPPSKGGTTVPGGVEPQFRSEVEKNPPKPNNSAGSSNFVASLIDNFNKKLFKKEKGANSSKNSRALESTNDSSNIPPSRARSKQYTKSSYKIGGKTFLFAEIVWEKVVEICIGFFLKNLKSNEDIVSAGLEPELFEECVKGYFDELRKTGRYDELCYPHRKQVMDFLGWYNNRLLEMQRYQERIKVNAA